MSISEFCAASHNRYWPNESVVDGGIGVIRSVCPVSFSQGSAMRARSSLSPTGAPVT